MDIACCFEDKKEKLCEYIRVPGDTPGLFYLKMPITIEISALPACI
jgi:hypothetical protein